jgi:hypothetical protein
MHSKVSTVAKKKTAAAKEENKEANKLRGSPNTYMIS